MLAEERRVLAAEHEMSLDFVDETEKKERRMRVRAAEHETH